MGQALDGSIANDLFRVRQRVSTAVDLVNRQGVLVSIEDAQSLFAMEGMAHQITIWGQDTQSAEALSARLSSLETMQAYEVLAWPELVPELVTIIETQRVTSFILLLFVFLAAAAGIANTTVMATFERRREFGMLIALGTLPSRIVAMVIAEAVILGIVGVSLGACSVVWQLNTWGSTGSLSRRLAVKRRRIWPLLGFNSTSRSILDLRCKTPCLV